VLLQTLKDEVRKIEKGKKEEKREEKDKKDDKDFLYLRHTLLKYLEQPEIRVHTTFVSFFLPSLEFIPILITSSHNFSKSSEPS